MRHTDKEIVAMLIKAGRRDLGRAYLAAVKAAPQKVKVTAASDMYNELINAITDYWKRAAAGVKVAGVQKVTVGLSADSFPVVNVLTANDQYRLVLQWTVGESKLSMEYSAKTNRRNRGTTEYKFNAGADYGDGTKILTDKIEDLLQYEG